MNGLQALLRREKRDSYTSALSFGDYLSMLSQWSYNGNLYPTFSYPQSGPNTEVVANNFANLVEGAYRQNGIVFACILTRQLLFSEVRFQFQQIRNGKPGDLFGTQDLAILEKPAPNMSTGELLVRAEQDASLAGNSYLTIRDSRGRPRIRRMRPDWVTIVMGSYDDPEMDGADLDAEVIGYIYAPRDANGRSIGKQWNLLPEQVSHFSPIPDPLANWRGMSWLTPVMREIQGDSAATEHKLRFFKNHATANTVVTIDPTVSIEAFKAFREDFNENHQGVLNAYKTLFLGGGADMKVVGSDFRQMDFKVTQGAGETRIAAASGVAAIVHGFSEGLQAATYSNFGQARRLVGDKWLRPQWRQMAASLETIVPPPSGARLWYDASDNSFLQEDEADRVQIQASEASTIKSLIDAGYEPNAVVDAVTSGDLTRLSDAHTGLFSVQLQPPGSGSENTDPAPTPAPPARSEPIVISPDVNITTPDVRVEVNLPEQSPPVVNVTVEPAQIEPPVVNVTVEPADVQVDVAPAAVTVEAPPTRTVVIPADPKPSRARRVEYDAEGRPVRLVEE